MASRTLPRPIVALALAVAVLTAGCAAAPATAAARPAPVAHETPAPGHGALDTVVRLTAQRLLVVDQVAAAKWERGLPVRDPARDRQVVDAGVARVRTLGADPVAAAAFFRDQIAAATAVQRVLTDEWDADPGSAPLARSGPAGYRAALDTLDDRLAHAFADTAAARADRLCVLRTAVDQARVSTELGLDTVHRTALDRALASACGARTVAG